MRQLPQVQTPQRAIMMDVFEPTAESSSPRPGVVLIHGGGWRNGSPSQFHDHAQRLADKGYVAVCIGYRLSQEAMWPAQLEDCWAGWRRVIELADELGLDPARLGVAGSSAGAHLAAMLGVKPEPGKAIVRPACVAAVHGVFDCPRRPVAESLTSMLGPIASSRAAWEDASPLQYVDGQSPPMLLTHTEDDPVVPFDQTQVMVEALVAASRPVEFMPTPGSGHGFVYNLENEWAQRVWPVVERWLDRWLVETP